jgi:penicillin-binding protein 1A
VAQRAALSAALRQVETEMSRRERHKRRRRNRGHPVKRVVLMACGLGVCAAIVAALAGVGWVVAVADTAPDISSLKAKTPLPLTQIFAGDGSPMGYVHSDVVYEFVPGPRLPVMLKHATVAIEDRRFYQHGALDYQGILRAGIKDLFSGKTSLQGASTLTMQLIDNMYLPNQIGAHHNLKYKIIQAKMAEQLEARHTKRWILDTYLNDVPYGTVGGETARGVGAAAEIFFNKPIGKLDLAQYALLAGLPQAPSSYNPFLHPKLAVARRHEVLVAMMHAQYITRPQAVVADHSPLQVQRSAKYASQPVEPYVFDYVVKQLDARYGAHRVQTGGLKVYTTIDLHDQQIARQALFSHEQGGVGNVNAALASVDASNGHILALAGTESYNQTKFFYPVQAQRQTGSAAKVFALMTLIKDDDGNPGSTYYVSKPLPAGWYPPDPTWSVHTDSYSYAGAISVAQATTISDNTVFAQLMVDLGVGKFESTAQSMGLPASQMIGAPAEVLGGWKNGITMLQMAAADTVLANGGNYYAPTIIDHVVFPDGSVDHWSQPPKRVFTDGQTYAATQVLKTVIQSGTGPLANYGCPAAGKTGTAENLANAWFVGYNPRIATAVWVGYPQGNISLGPNGFGGTLAAPIWHDYMQKASAGYCGDFPPPSNPFFGTQFFGLNAAAGASKVGTGTSTGTSTTTGKTAKTKPGYNNSGLFSHNPGGKTGTGNGTTGTGHTGTGTGRGKRGGGGPPTGGTGGAGVPGH